MAKMSEGEYNVMRMVRDGARFNSRQFKEYGVDKDLTVSILSALRERRLVRDQSNRLTDNGFKAMAIVEEGRE